MNPIKALFIAPPATLAKRQLVEAQILYLKHAAEAERHAALAKMYEERVSRINGGFEPKVAVATDAAGRTLRAAK